MLPPDKPQNIVILTGAGISAESGINTFRDNNGLWENHRLEDVATPEAFERDPELVQRFYNLRRQQLTSGTVHPNLAHKALADLEHNSHHKVFVVTQNVDDLHERAGSKNIHHMHGELLKSRCDYTDIIFEQQTDIESETLCPCCDAMGRLRPHIVWFGEMPLDMERIYRELEQCDLFISIGTSGHVYPAAGFVEVANGFGAHTVELNLEPSEITSAFKETIHGPASHLVPEYLRKLYE